MIKILNLRKEIILENIEELVKLDQFIEIGERWGNEHFLMELDGKWDNSFAALVREKIVGFIICSLKSKNTLHIHRLVVNKEYQKIGVGTQLITQVINRLSTINNNISYITLKVEKNNTLLQKFYEINKFKRLNIENKNYIYRRIL